MESMPQTTQSRPSSAEALPSAKQLEIEAKRDRFYKRLKLILLGVLSLIFLIIVFTFAQAVYHQTKKTYVANPNEDTLPEQQIIIKEELPEKIEEWEIYSSSSYRFSFDYPKGDAIVVSDISKDEFSVQIRSSNILPNENPKGDNLVKGYIFQVIPYKLAASGLDSAVNIKRDWFTSTCPKTATISPVTNRKVAQLNAKGFDISDCNSEFTVIYITANNLVYEVMLVYKGDLGFRQIYKSRTNQILNTLVIDVDSPETSPTTVYRDNNAGFSFFYPRGMDAKCCSVPEPLQEDLATLVILAENDNTDAIGFFYSFRNYRTGFEAYLETQKNKLIDEYTIVKNKAPAGSQTEIIVDGQKAVQLSGYSWRGNDLIYIPLPKKENVLIISKTNLSEEAFNTIINSLNID